MIRKQEQVNMLPAHVVTRALDSQSPPPRQRGPSNPARARAPHTAQQGCGLRTGEGVGVDNGQAARDLVVELCGVEVAAKHDARLGVRAHVCRVVRRGDVQPPARIMGHECARDGSQHPTVGLGGVRDQLEAVHKLAPRVRRMALIRTKRLRRSI